MAKGATRFIGANIPIELFETMEAARAEHGISDRSAAIRAACTLWVNQNPPREGIPAAVAALLRETSKARAVREAIDAASLEYRLGRSKELLEHIKDLAEEAGNDVEVSRDIRDAIEEELDNST